METLLLEVHKCSKKESDPVCVRKLNTSQTPSSRDRGCLRQSRAVQPRSRFCEISKNSGEEEKVFKSHWVTQCNSLSVAAKQACAKASLRSLLAEEEETHSDPEEELDVSDI